MTSSDSQSDSIKAGVIEQAESLYHFNDYGIVSAAYLTKPSLEGMPVTSPERPCEILSVDDDPINQMVISSVLESSGFTVHQAMDGFEALDYMSTTTKLPDLILLDVMMPGMSGYEVCAKLRAQYSPDLPIIMISAKNSSDDVIKGLRYKCNDYVTKPFEKTELLARISSQVKLRQMVGIQARHRMALRIVNTILPDDVAEQTTGGILDYFAVHGNVALVNCHVDGLSLKSPGNAVLLLNRYFKDLDEKVSTDQRVQKIETSTDAYTVATGMSPEECDEHMAHALEIGLLMIELAEANELQVTVRIDHMRNVGAGLIRTSCPRYMLFDNGTRSSLCPTSISGTQSIQMSQGAYEIFRGQIENISQEKSELLQRINFVEVKVPGPSEKSRRPRIMYTAALGEKEQESDETIDNCDGLQCKLVQQDQHGEKAPEGYLSGLKILAGDTQKLQERRNEIVDLSGEVGRLQYNINNLTKCLSLAQRISTKNIEGARRKVDSGKVRHRQRELRYEIQELQRKIRSLGDSKHATDAPKISSSCRERIPKPVGVEDLSSKAVLRSTEDLRHQNDNISERIADISKETSAIRRRVFAEHPEVLELEELEKRLDDLLREREAMENSI
ncbi:hypothetical protein FOL47_001466 [Perkinsus chesapeaki]|uniref:Uncharacterized protein n=1 Tax=Perkinsus chesapeaki TaxID=330153 RepID=A0A7J6MIT6_PERCH|nr:hypothetical protein FOL47_001466 [Perkinsus chesapeaki]